MKRMKKLFAILMTMAMVMGLSITGFAADSYEKGTITVNGLPNITTNVGSYVQILVPDIDAPGGYSFASGVTIMGENKALSAKEFMDLNVLEQKEALKREGTVLPEGTPGTISNGVFSVGNLIAGYYVVEIIDTNSKVIYDNPMILSIQYDKATLKDDKSGYDYNVSKIQEDNVVTAKYTTIPTTKEGKDKNDETNNDIVGVTGTATYTIETYIPSNVTKFELIDRLTDASYNQETVKVQIDTLGDVTDELEGKINFDAVEKVDEDYNMKIDLTQYVTGANANKYSGKKVTVTYDVTVTGTKVENTVEPGDGTHDYEPGTDTLYTGGIQLTKYKEDETPMNGASFVVYKTVRENDKNVNYYAKVDNSSNVLIEWTADKSEASKLTTGEDGVIVVDGLDLGFYSFEEVEAPEGYSINPEIKTVQVTTENTNKVTLYTRASTSMTDTTLIGLPSTGGMGTTIFTIAGCVIMISAAGLFFASRRKAN